MRSLIQAYLEDLRLSGKSGHTVRNYEKHLEKLAEWCESEGVDFREINGKGSKAFRNWLVGQGLAPRTVNTILAAVKSFYDFLLEREIIRGNPWTLRRLRVAEERRLPDFLTEEEEKAVRKALKDLPSHIALAFETMAATGLRVGEVARLTPEDVLLREGKVLVYVHEGKGKKDRLVPVVEKKTARALLDFAKERRGEPSLFGVTDGTLKTYAHELKRATGVDFHSHRLRHTFATRLRSKGVALDTIQKLLGHTSIATTNKYAAVMPEEVLELGAKI